MKKPSMKSINAALPRFDVLRRNYVLCGYCGPLSSEILESAFADLDENGNVEQITIYSVGDAMERRHYYGCEGTVEITEAIEAAISGEAMAECHYDHKVFRHFIIELIQDMIAGQL